MNGLLPPRIDVFAPKSFEFVTDEEVVARAKKLREELPAELVEPGDVPITEEEMIFARWVLIIERRNEQYQKRLVSEALTAPDNRS